MSDGPEGKAGCVITEHGDTTRAGAEMAWWRVKSTQPWLVREHTV